MEFDGPDHFLACGRSPDGGTLLKHRHLRQLGYALVVVPYWEWDQVSGDEALKDEYLRGKLDASCVGAPAAASSCRMEQADVPIAAGAARMDRKSEEERLAGKKRAWDSGLKNKTWQVAYSEKRRRYYYFNRVTGESRWSKPDGEGDLVVEAPPEVAGEMDLSRSSYPHP